MSASPLRRIPRTVWVLGFVSLLMDVSSEMIHAVLPLFMVQVLAADVFWVGLIEGAAEAVALAAKVFSGVIADRFGRHKVLVFAGYALGVLSKPVFAIADTVTTVFFARFADRIGKGGAARLGTRSSRTSRPRNSWAPPTGFANRSMRPGPSSAPPSPQRSSSPSRKTPSGRSSGWR